MVKYVLIGAAAVIAVLLYVCLIAASNADDAEERWFDER